MYYATVAEVNRRNHMTYKPNRFNDWPSTEKNFGQLLGHYLKNFSEPHHCINEVQSHDLPYEETTNLPILFYFLLPSVIYTI